MHHDCRGTARVSRGRALCQWVIQSYLVGNLPRVGLNLGCAHIECIDLAVSVKRTLSLHKEADLPSRRDQRTISRPIR